MALNIYPRHQLTQSKSAVIYRPPDCIPDVIALRETRAPSTGAQMNDLQQETPSEFTGMTALILALAIVAIALSLVAPTEVSLDPLGRTPSPYAALR